MIVLCLGLSILSAVFWNLVTRHFWVAFIRATLTATLLTWLLTMSHFGWMDETFLKNLAMTLGLTAIPAMLVTGASKYIRPKRAE